uniref:Uncharacterized protein n=1 Tax=Parastrongyloides trichosuri TaxID=131310 RepID=A0A0N4Z474_PARTI
MMNRIDGERNLFESQFNESNNMIYTPPSILSSRRSIQLPVTSPRQNLSPFSDEDKISVDVMRRLTTFDNTKLLDFVGWLNTKEDNIKNNFNNDNTSSTTNNRPCRGNSIPNYTSNQSTNYNLYHSDSLNYSSSSKSSSDSSNGLFGLIKNKISINNDTNRRSSNNIIPSDKKKFR